MITTAARTSEGLDRVPPTVRPAPARLRLIRLVTATVIIAPVIGTMIALWLAVANGVATTSLAASAIGYGITILGITLAYHRYFCHGAFKTSPAMQVAFVIAGSMALQGSLLYWVSTHRRHHQFADAVGDPHSPNVTEHGPLGPWSGVWHAHIGWMFAREMTNAIRYAPDIVRDPFVFRVQQLYPLWAALGILLPTAVLGLIGRSWYSALEAFLWVGSVRVFLAHNATWSVGSISHRYGRRPFATGDQSTNNMLAAVIAFGEGLQNNHHAFPTAAHHAFHWWEPDLTGWLISALDHVGLIWDVKHPTAQALAARRRAKSSIPEEIKQEEICQ
jgi:stearoyl-CoA desaturase (Delta-9 desaturase)